MLMNWYVYWYFTVRYASQAFFGRGGNDWGGSRMAALFFFCPFFALWTLPSLALSLWTGHDCYMVAALCLSALFLLANIIVFWEDTHRFRHWDNLYRNLQTESRNKRYVLLSVAGTLLFFIGPVLIRECLFS